MTVPSRAALLMIAAGACVSTPLRAQRAADLRGIYVVSNALPLSTPNSATLASSLTVPGVDGLVLVIGWSAIEPTMGGFQWKTLDEWMSRADSAGLKVTLSVRADIAPSWLFQAAAALPRSR